MLMGLRSQKPGIYRSLARMDSFPFAPRRACFTSNCLEGGFVYTLLSPGFRCQDDSERIEGSAPAAILSSAVIAFQHDTSPVSTFDRIAAQFC
jgi:hypothetical protein